MLYVINNMEIWVEKCLNEAVKDLNMCKCDKCLKDVYALTLNRLKPKYIIADKGIESEKVDFEFEKSKENIISCIRECALIVSENPKHDIVENDSVVNFEELFVENYMKEILKGNELINTDEYIRQIYVMVLNNIKPVYTVTKQGELYSKVNSNQGQYRTEIFLEITKAIDIINMKIKKENKN